MAFRPTTLNPSAKGATVTLSGGDLTAVFAASSAASVRSIASIPAGRYYFEAKIVASDTGGGLSGFRVGLCSGAMPLDTADPYASQVKLGVIAESDEVFFAGSPGGVTGTAFLVVGDVVGLHIDTDAHTVQVYVNGVASGAEHTNAAIAPGLYPFVGFNGSSSATLTVQVNFGGGAFLTPTLAGTTMGVVGLIPTTWNPSDKDSTITLSNGNLTESATGGAVRSAFGVSVGKYYFEYKFSGSTGQMMGVGSPETAIGTWPGSDAYSVAFERATGGIYQGGGSIYYGTAGATTVGVLLDADNKTVQLRRNNVNLGSPIALAGSKFYAIAGYYDKVIANFGATPFTYAVPAGFTAGFGEEPWRVLAYSSDVTLVGARPQSAILPTTWSLTDKGPNEVVSGDTIIGGYGAGRSVFSATSGRWYWEISFAESSSGAMAGVATAAASVETWPGADAYAWALERNTNYSYSNGVGGAMTPSVVAGVLGIALDLFNNTLRLYADGDLLAPTISISRSGAPVFAIAGYLGESTANFGATEFLYPVPPGYERGFGELEVPFRLVAVSTTTLSGASGSAEAQIGGTAAAVFSSILTLGGVTGQGTADVADPGASVDFAGSVALDGAAGAATAGVLCAAAQAVVLGGVAQDAVFGVATLPAREAAQSTVLAGATGVATAIVLCTAAQSVALGGVDGEALATTAALMRSAITLEGAAGASAATALVRANQTTTLAGVISASSAEIFLNATQTTDLDGTTQHTAGGPVVEAQTQAALEGAASEAAYLVITYARATTALEGASGDAAATVLVTGSVSAWLEDLQSIAAATVEVKAQASTALEGVENIAALLRFGERDFSRDVSCVLRPLEVAASSASWTAHAQTAPNSATTTTRPNITYVTE